MLLLLLAHPMVPYDPGVDPDACGVGYPTHKRRDVPDADYSPTTPARADAAEHILRRLARTGTVYIETADIAEELGLSTKQTLHVMVELADRDCIAEWATSGTGITWRITITDLDDSTTADPDLDN